MSPNVNVAQFKSFWWDGSYGTLVTTQRNCMFIYIYIHRSLDPNMQFSPFIEKLHSLDNSKKNGKMSSITFIVKYGTMFNDFSTNVGVCVSLVVHPHFAKIPHPYYKNT